MIEICLKNKIIFNFLENYKQKKWINIIPSLLEIAVLNLYTSFKRYVFSEEELSLIIENLKTKYNPPSLLEKNFNQKKIINKNKKEILDINIPKFRKNMKLYFLQNHLNERKHSYRSYSKKAKNINELNIYSTYENKKKRHYNKSTEVTPMKGLINYNETDISFVENRYNNLFYLNQFDKSHHKNNIKNLNIYSNKIVDYNTIDHSENINKTYQNLFNIYKTNRQNMNYSISVEKKNHNKKYIKVNKNRSNNIIIENNNYNDIGYIMKKDNRNSGVSGESSFKTNKILNHKIFNYYDKKIKNNFNLFTNINQSQIVNQDRIKKNLNFNNANYYQDKKLSKNNNNIISRTSNNSFFHNSPNKKYSGLTKLQKNKNSIINNSQINKKITDFKKVQLSNIKKNFKEINLRNIFNKQRKTENVSNKELINNINNTIVNIKDINASYFKNNKNIFNEGQYTMTKDNKRKKIINYNSFNNNKNMKKAIFLNDPKLFINSSRTKKLLFGKKININANGKDNILE